MAGIWPGTTQCAVALTFDIDGVSSWLRRNPDFAKLPSLMSMAEYGPSVAAWRILDLLDTYGIKVTFFIPGYVAETHEPLVREIVRRGHEVGHHGYMHEPPATMDRDEEARVLDRGIEVLQRITGERPIGYRSPAWELSEHSLTLLAERGFRYDTSLMGDDAPYWVESPKGSLVELPIHWLLDDAIYFVHVPAAQRFSPLKSPDEVYSIWRAEFEGMYRYGRAFILTMHPQHIGRPGRLLMLERLIKHMRSFPNVTFMRLDEMYRIWETRGR